jgi:hypothetical protein
MSMAYQGKTWYRIDARKAHCLGGNEQVRVYIWAYDSDDAFERLKKVPGIKRDSLPYEAVKMSAPEAAVLENKIWKTESSGNISLAWAKRLFFCEDFEHYHPRGKLFSKVEVTVEKKDIQSKVQVYLYAFTAPQQNRCFTPRSHSKSKKCRRRKSYYTEPNQKSQLQVKLDAYVFTALRNLGYTIIGNTKPEVLIGIEFSVLRQQILDNFRTQKGNISMFEAEKFFFSTPESIAQDFIERQRRQLSS